MIKKIVNLDKFTYWWKYEHKFRQISKSINELCYS